MGESGVVCCAGHLTNHMGLDFVKLIMSYEETFGIKIPDAIASNLVTVGLAHEYIVQAAQSKMPPLSSEFIWDKIVEVSAKQLGIKSSLITKDSHYVKDLGCGCPQMMECNVKSRNTVDRFRKAYVITVCAQGAIFIIVLINGILSGQIDYITPVIFLCSAVAPFIPMLLKGEMTAHLSIAIWISRVYAVFFSIVQVYAFVGLFEPIRAPYVYITSMVLFALFYLCPWLITALRSFQLEHPAKPAK